MIKIKAVGRKKILALLFVLALGVGIFIIGRSVEAAWYEQVTAWFLGLFVRALGQILILVIKAMVWIAGYQNFINSQAVSLGWVIVRDLCNMLFVVVLLVIAFGTILHLENYSYKKWLPKLVLMAILINFSKTICGLMIDLAQVVMLTFVNAFQDIAGANITDILGLSDIVTLAQSSSDVGWGSIVGAYFLGVIYLIVAIIVITTMLGMLVMRLVMIWLYVVLSPIAYLLAAFPGGQSWASKWWSEFIKNLIVGPVIAFFLWLSLASLQTGAPSVIDTKSLDEVTKKEMAAMDVQSGDTTKPTDVPVAASEASKPGALIKFVIAIGMLIGGLKIAQEVGGEAGSIAGKGMAAIGKAKNWGLSGGKNLAVGIKDTTLGAVARSQRVKDTLGTIGSTSGARGAVLGALGIRGAAVKARVGLEAIDKKKRDKAKEYTSQISDPRILERLASQNNLESFTPWRREVRSAARNKMGYHMDSGAVIGDVNNMTQEDLSSLNHRQIADLARRGVRAADGSAFQEHLRNNRTARRAYNEGVEQRTIDTGVAAVPTDYVQGINSRTGMENGDLGFNRVDFDFSDIDGTRVGGAHAHPSPANFRYVRGTAPNDDPYRYSRESDELEPNTETQVSPDKINKQRGRGNLSINEFARGQSNTIAYDFDKLNLKGMDKKGASDLRGVKGINTSDDAAIKEICSKMVGAIDQELAGLKAKGSNLSVGEQKRMTNLNQAREKFSEPEKIDNLSLLNSSAASYKVSDAKKTKIHEELHGLGYEDEEQVRAGTQKIIDTKQYDARKDKSSLDKIMASVAPARRPVSDVLAEENGAENKEGGEKMPIGKGPEIPEINTVAINDSLSDFSKKLQDLGKKMVDLSSVTASGAGQPGGKTNFTYLFRNLRKAINNQSVNLKKFVSLNGNKAETPLEINVVADQLGKDIK